MNKAPLTESELVGGVGTEQTVKLPGTGHEEVGIFLIESVPIVYAPAQS